MNASDAAAYLPLVQALAEGRVVQRRFGDQCHPVWRDCVEIRFDTEAPEFYRVKPKPREVWVPWVGGHLSLKAYASHDACKLAWPSYTPVRFIEAPEDAP